MLLAARSGEVVVHRSCDAVSQGSTLQQGYKIRLLNSQFDVKKQIYFSRTFLLFVILNEYIFNVFKYDYAGFRLL